jgi:hypothetical protein
VNGRGALVCSTPIHFIAFRFNTTYLPLCSLLFVPHVSIKKNPIGILRKVLIDINIFSDWYKFIQIGRNTSNFQKVWYFFLSEIFFEMLAKSCQISRKYTCTSRVYSYMTSVLLKVPISTIANLHYFESDEIPLICRNFVQTEIFFV